MIIAKKLLTFLSIVGDMDILNCNVTLLHGLIFMWSRMDNATVKPT